MKQLRISLVSLGMLALTGPGKPAQNATAVAGQASEIKVIARMYSFDSELIRVITSCWSSYHSTQIMDSNSKFQQRPEVKEEQHHYNRVPVDKAKLPHPSNDSSQVNRLLRLVEIAVLPK